MFQAWRWKLRAAEEALAEGRPQDAGRMLQEDGLLEFLPGRRLGQRTAQQLAERARCLLVEGEVEKAWSVWDEARQLAGEPQWLHDVRQEMIALAIHDIESQLLAGNASGASSLMKKLSARGLAPDELAQLGEVQKRLELARSQALRGKCAEAAENLAVALGVRPRLAGLEAERTKCLERAQKLRELSPRLHQALSSEQWTEAVALADQLLELAPQMPLALEARRKAWATVGAQVGEPRRFAETQHWSPERAAEGSREQRESRMSSGSDSQRAGSRFLMWVDAVGGFLVCLDSSVVLGQAVPGNHVDLPILGDLSRQHARIRRQGEAYLIEPLGPVWLRGRQLAGPEPLVDGDEIQLGGMVRLRFRQPHALSATARLDFVSRHRTPLAADAILLLAESCVLGPRKSNHVICKDWSQDVIVYRKDERLYCRAMDSIEIDGRLCDGRGELTHNSRVSGEEFSLSLESL